MRTALDEAAALVQRLAASYSKTLSAAEADVFVEVLVDLDADIATRAVERVRSIDQWFPSVARLRHIAAELIVDRAADGPAPPRSETSEVHPDVLRSQVAILRQVTRPAFATEINAACDAAYGIGQWGPNERAHVVRGLVYDRVVADTCREPCPDP